MEKYIKKDILIPFFLLMLAALSGISCREDCDEVLYYSKWNTENFEEANTSMGGQFKAFWTAMNCNYPMWDYEAECGVDWDAVYDKYLPIFEKADRQYQETGIIMTDSVFKVQYNEIMSLLHDGHTELNIKNLHTGELHSFAPSIINIIDEENVEDAQDFLFEFFITPQTSYYESQAVNEDEKITETVTASEVYQFSLFKDGIVYLRLKDCNLPNHFNESLSEYNSQTSSQARQVWRKWFETTQEMHGNNTLKGVIIDVRGNLGGFAEISKYAFGALHNNKYHNTNAYQRGYVRTKNGIGRLDFSPVIPMLWSICEEEHVEIVEPIVVLANSLTASSAEHICLDAKKMSNGCVIGTNTYGAFSPLSETYDSLFYVGHVGCPGKTSFYLDIPSCVFISDDGEFLDGNGVKPDIEIVQDWNLYLSTGRDKQLERALEYIRKQ